MEIRFTRNAYLDAVRISAPAEHYSKLDTLFVYAQTTPQFHYGDARYSEFCDSYSSKGRVKRKFLAVPAVLGVIIAAIYHLAKALIIGVPKKIFGTKNYYFKAEIYSSV